jgi:DNA repair photolyase
VGSVSLRLSLRELLYEKVRLREELSARLGHERAARAGSDYHARKPPVHCGATVHSVLGCTYRCAYCYLPDMGISFAKAQPYGLNGEEMALALLSNPFFLPGRLGTYIAFGSLGEPLHEVGASRTMEYAEAFSRLLHNPMQLSTKAAVGEQVAARLAKLETPLNPLVTIVTLKASSKLEPGAPSPWERLESVRSLRKAGLHPMVFLRPLIPGFEEDALEIVKEAKRRGAAAVVLGSLRVTPSIVARLKAAGVDVSSILSEVGDRLKKGVQVSVPLHQTKEVVAEEARRTGLTPLYSACCASTLNVYLKTGRRVPCPGLDFIDERFCAKCPVSCRSIKVEIDLEEVKWAARELLGISAFSVEEEGFELRLSVENLERALSRLRRKVAYKTLLETAYRRRLNVRKA